MIVFHLSIRYNFCLLVMHNKNIRLVYLLHNYMYGKTLSHTLIDSNRYFLYNFQYIYTIHKPHTTSIRLLTQLHRHTFKTSENMSVTGAQCDVNITRCFGPLTI